MKTVNRNTRLQFPQHQTILVAFLRKSLLGLDRSESRELHDVVSMATINEQQTSGSNNGKSKMNRLRWKRVLSAVKDKKYRSDQDEN